MATEKGNKYEQIGWGNISYGILDVAAWEKIQEQCAEDGTDLPDVQPFKVIRMRFGKQLLKNDSGDRNLVRVAESLGGEFTIGEVTGINTTAITIRGMDQKTQTDDLNADSFGKVATHKVKPVEADAPVSADVTPIAATDIPF